MSDKQKDLNTLNGAGRSMSDNVNFISPKNGYVIYESKWSINRELDAARDISERNPEYMTDDEIAFLDDFVEEFMSAEKAGSYNLENQAYLRLFRSLLDALDSRMNEERKNLVEMADPIAYRIQHIFYLIDSALSSEFESMEDNWEGLIRGNKSLVSSADRVNDLLKQCVRAYKFEFDYMGGEDVDIEEVNMTASILRDQWRDTVEVDDNGVNA